MPGTFVFKSVDLLEHSLLLLLGYALFPAKGEHVDEHGNSVTIEP